MSDPPQLVIPRRPRVEYPVTEYDFVRHSVSHQKTRLPGRCRLCGRKLQGRRSSFCDDTCGRYWGLLHSWGDLSYAVYLRDGERCVLCGKHLPVWSGEAECDHIVPVVEGGGQLGPDNLQTLCHECHVAKTAAQNRERRAKGRAQTQLAVS